MPRSRQPISWEQLHGKVDPAILSAPNVSWDQVEKRSLRVLLQIEAGEPWLNHLALLAVILASYARLDANTARQYLQDIQARWQRLLPAYDLITMAQWNPVEHLPRYIHDSQLPDSPTTRQVFLTRYKSAAGHAQSYLRSLSTRDQAIYQQWILPNLPSEVVRQLSREAELQEIRQKRRKQETDALAPHFAQLRAEVMSENKRRLIRALSVFGC